MYELGSAQLKDLNLVLKDVKYINFYFDDLWYKQTKFLRSSSKQSRMVKVFCK
jgi:hypothetical protein